MRTLGKFSAGVCAILFVITGVLALLFFNIERKAFSAETYKQAFEKQQLYDRMPGILAQVLTSAIRQNPLVNAYLKSLTVQDWESFISALIPPEELKALLHVERRSQSWHRCRVCPHFPQVRHVETSIRAVPKFWWLEFVLSRKHE